MLRGDLLDEPGGEVCRGAAEEHPLGSTGEIEPLLGPGQGHIAQAALLFQLFLLPDGTVAGENPLLHANGKDDGKLQPLGRVHGHEGDAVVPVLHAVQVGVQGHLVQEAP